MFTFDSEIMSSGQLIFVMADDLVEREESFTLKLELVNTSANVQILQDEATVTITDQDGKLHFLIQN